MLIFNNKKFSEDVYKKINGAKIKDAAKECHVPYPSLWRAANQKGNIDINNLAKLLQWLNKPFEYYLKKEAPMRK